MNLATRLKETREERGLTRDKAAKQLDVSYWAVAGWERTNNIPTKQITKVERWLESDATTIKQPWVITTKPKHLDLYTQRKGKWDTLINAVNALDATQTIETSLSALGFRPGEVKRAKGIIRAAGRRLKVHVGICEQAGTLYIFKEDNNGR